ncbi:MAG: hypothetical protein J2P48_11310 [Alphaproteobacteria bacterium]|nr:hypothetical protein [Alphaproteobacteria bacterium]
MVTGGGGIGREIARRFAQEGMSIAVLDRDARRSAGGCDGDWRVGSYRRGERARRSGR